MSSAPTLVTRGAGFIEVATNDGVFTAGPDVATADPDAQSLYSLLRQSYKRFADRPCLGFRRRRDDGELEPAFSWLTYAQVGSVVASIGSALVSFGVSQRSAAAILAPNCPEWIIAEHAMCRQNVVSVPLFPNFAPEVLVEALRKAGAKIAFCALEHVGVLLNAAGLAPGQLTRIIVISPHFDSRESSRRVPEELAEQSSSLGIELVAWDEAVKVGEKTPADEAPSVSGDVFSVVFTSGATGTPKGAVLLNRNIVAVTELMSHCQYLFPKGIYEQVHLSYLPLAHVFERQFTHTLLRNGAAVGYFCGILSKLFEEINMLRPTLMIGVPRVWKRLYDRVMGTVAKSGFLSRTLFNLALSTKAAAEKQGSSTWIPWDKIIFSKMHEKLGGRCNFLFSGGAAITPDLASWLSRCFLVEVFQGYGMTESCGGVFLQYPPFHRKHRGSIGIPGHSVSLRVVDIPEMDFLTTSQPPQGEIWIKGPFMFSGYLGDEEQTSLALSEDRKWLRTGDVGTLNEDGSVTLVDRTKSIFKLSQGEFVPAENVESILSQSPLVSQVWVHGEPTDSFVVAVVVPELETLRDAMGQGVPEGDGLCTNEAARTFVLENLEQEARKAGLPSFQIPKAVWLTHKPFTPENGLITPTFKLRRNSLKTAFSSTLQELRNEGQKRVANKNNAS